MDKELGRAVKCRNSANERSTVTENKGFPLVREFSWMFKLAYQLRNIKYNILEDPKSVYITIFGRKHAVLLVCVIRFLKKIANIKIR